MNLPDKAQLQMLCMLLGSICLLCAILLNLTEFNYFLETGFGYAAMAFGLASFVLAPRFWS
jgi:hypothetical protein